MLKLIGCDASWEKKAVKTIACSPHVLLLIHVEARTPSEKLLVRELRTEYSENGMTFHLYKRLESQRRRRCPYRVLEIAIRHSRTELCRKGAANRSGGALTHRD